RPARTARGLGRVVPSCLGPVQGADGPGGGPPRRYLNGRSVTLIRLVFLLRRRPQLSLSEFQERWLDHHGPLVASHQMPLNILRYTQSHRIDDGNGEGKGIGGARGEMEPPYDGAAELWWESEAALAEAGATPTGRAASQQLLADEEEFVDLPQSP